MVPPPLSRREKSETREPEDCEHADAYGSMTDFVRAIHAVEIVAARLAELEHGRVQTMHRQQADDRSSGQPHCHEVGQVVSSHHQ